VLSSPLVLSVACVLLPLQVVVREESKHWYKFLTTLCAGERSGQ
jgi:hypothetical protein